MTSKHSSKSSSQSYADAGVDITAGYKAVELMKDSVAKTATPGAIGKIGDFGGLFMPDFSDMKSPMLVSSTDGVGTKLKIAMELGKHDTIGIDCVAMCVNDIICCGAKPLFFLDYIACGKNYPEKIASIVSGIAEGCVQAGCALIGGETAEHPGMMAPDNYDVAGFAVGVVDRENLLHPEEQREGDVLIGLASSGVHSNGFSLIRKIYHIDDERESCINERYDISSDEILGKALLTPTTIYVKPIQNLLKEVPVKAISHITGGGFYENIPRILPSGLTAFIERSRIQVPTIFKVIACDGDISDREMFNIFNMGVGMVVSVSPVYETLAIASLESSGVHAYKIGRLVKGDYGVVIS